MVGVRQITIDHQSTKVSKTDRETVTITITGKAITELSLESLRRGQVKCVSSRILFPISGINSVSLTFFCFLGG